MCCTGKRGLTILEVYVEWCAVLSVCVCVCVCMCVCMDGYVCVCICECVYL